MRIKNKARRPIAKKTIKRRKSGSKIQKAILTGKSLLILAILFIAMIIYINSEAIFRDFYQLTGKAGFVIKNINITGQKHISDKQIAETLKIKIKDPILAVSLPELKERLEKLEWIKSATVERELPYTINVTIVERTPIALGQKDRKLYIIDESGAVINEKNLSAYSTLPIIIGDGAEIYASSLLKILKSDIALYKHINAIIRVSEHRWNIRFDNELEIKLPDENIEKAWKKVIKMNKDKMLFLPENAAIDLRIPNKIFIEKK